MMMTFLIDMVSRQEIEERFKCRGALDIGVQLLCWMRSEIGCRISTPKSSYLISGHVSRKT